MAHPLIRSLFAPSAPASEEEAEVRFFVRVTAVVLAGMIAGMFLDWVPEEPSPWRWLPLGIAYLVGGWRIALDTWEDLKEGRLSIDFLMGAAAVGAAVVDEPLEGVILIFLFSLSNTLEAYAMGRTRRAVGSLMEIRPEEATLSDEEGNDLGRVPIEDLQEGRYVLVRPGERIAADGEVVQGESSVDQSAITGESARVEKGPGSEVFAGTMNGRGALVLRVTRDPEQTMLAKIIRLVSEARDRKAPAQQFIDRFAHPYTLAVVAGTSLAFLVPWGLLDVSWNDALYRAMSLLVVASPCALVISTPSAVLSAIANGARHGILFKGGAYLDLAGTIDTVAFDKTGTLTVGRARLLAVSDLDGGASEEEILRLAAAVERRSEHHLAKAVVEAAEEHGITCPRIDDFEAVSGRGVRGRLDGESIWVGNASFAAAQDARETAPLAGWTAEQNSLGRTVVWVGRGDRVVGALALGDALRRNAPATIRHLKLEGIRWVVMLTGDHPEVARAVAAELGVDQVRAGLLPDQKVEAIRELISEEGGVTMVGDGVNDAPAMAASTVGIAMGAAGTDVAIETADVVLMSDDLEKVDYVIHLGKRTRKIVKQNVWFSVGWMALLVAVTLTVGLPLPLAVVGHEGSTLLVAANGLRLLTSAPHPPTDGSHRD
ncbi:MAG: heavy metal translocating P-type ATPase [bacterium]